LKKLLIICLLTITTFTVKAQTAKTTKEQTINYLTRIFSLTEGEKTLNKTTKYTTNFEYTACLFSIDKIIEKYNFETVWNDPEKTKNGMRKYTSSNLKWETVTSVNLGSQLNNLTIVSITFSAKYKLTVDEEESGQENVLNLLVVNNKAGSFKKALDQLVEIMKEENKDPFQN